MHKFLKFFENVEFSCIMSESFIIVVTLFVLSLCTFFEGRRGRQGWVERGRQGRVERERQGRVKRGRQGGGGGGGGGGKGGGRGGWKGGEEYMQRFL